MEIKTWRKLDERLIYNGFRKISKKLFIMPDGKLKDFEIITKADYVCILPLTSKNNVILAKQFRPGPEKIYEELPAGFIEANENPIIAAKRELLEETGYSGSLEYVCSGINGAYADYLGHCFIAKNCIKIQDTKTDENEFIEVIEKPLREFKRQLKLGQLTNTDLAYRALDHLNLLN